MLRIVGACDHFKYVSDSNQRLKSAVDMPICVLKRGDLCDYMSSRENEARFLHENEVNLHNREIKWPSTIRLVGGHFVSLLCKFTK